MSMLLNRVVLVGVGGASCSGKTTVARCLQDILPNSVIIYQDDFAPPEVLIPIHPVHNLQDWDSPQGAIDWPRLRAFLKNVKEKGVIPPDHRNQAHVDEWKDTPVTDSTRQELKTRFREVEDEQRKKGFRIIWGIVDGFLLYWDKEIIEQLDIQFFLRVPHDLLKQRRNQRRGYHTAGKNWIILAPSSSSLETDLRLPLASTRLFVRYTAADLSIPASRNAPTLGCPFGDLRNPEEALWQDPPMYWEYIVYPAYVEVHKDIFEGGDVENGKLTGQRVPDLVMMEPMKKGAEMSVDDIVRRCCDTLGDHARALTAN